MGVPVTRWRCTYQGKPDLLSESGCAQPSWMTFDKRVWEKVGDPTITITLTNLTNDEGIRTPRTIATYAVTLRWKKRILERRVTTNWQRGVQSMKRR